MLFYHNSYIKVQFCSGAPENTDFSVHICPICYILFSVQTSEAKEMIMESNAKIFREGFRDGIPIGLGYFAVAFSLGSQRTDMASVLCTDLLQVFLPMHLQDSI